MNSVERVSAVLAGEIPDRIPISLLSFQNAASFSNQQLSRYCSDPNSLAQAQIAYWEEFRHDVIDIENGVATLAEAVGCKVEYPEVSSEPPWIVKPVLKSLSEMGKLSDIDIFKSPLCRALVEGTRLVAEKLGDQAVVRGESDLGPFSLAVSVFGAENLLIALMDEENHPQIHQLLRYCRRQISKLVYAQMEAGSRFSMIGDSYAGPDVCSPAHYREFAFPYEKELIDHFADENICVGLHICGNATGIADQMVKTGAKYLEIDHKIDRAKVRLETLKHKISIFGTVDPGDLMLNGTEEEIISAVKRDISELGRNGYYILSHGCTLPYNIPHKNIRTFVDAGREFGRYPQSALMKTLETNVH